jgi:hypothetical protein
MSLGLASFVAIVGELLYWLRGAIGGWRYLFSRSYRERTHARWRRRNSVYAAVEIVSAVGACAASLCLLYFLVKLVTS